MHNRALIVQGFDTMKDDNGNATGTQKNHLKMKWL